MIFHTPQGEAAYTLDDVTTRLCYAQLWGVSLRADAGPTLDRGFLTACLFGLFRLVGFRREPIEVPVLAFADNGVAMTFSGDPRSRVFGRFERADDDWSEITEDCED